MSSKVALVSCPICMECYDETVRIPKVLFCGNGHSLCSSCITDLLSLSFDALCPICRGNINLKGTDFPTNRAVLEALQAYEKSFELSCNIDECSMCEIYRPEAKLRVCIECKKEKDTYIYVCIDCVEEHKHKFSHHAFDKAEDYRIVSELRVRYGLHSNEHRTLQIVKNNLTEISNLIECNEQRSKTLKCLINEMVSYEGVSTLKEAEAHGLIIKDSEIVEKMAKMSIESKVVPYLKNLLVRKDVAINLISKQLCKEVEVDVDNVHSPVLKYLVATLFSLLCAMTFKLIM